MLCQMIYTWTRLILAQVKTGDLFQGPGGLSCPANEAPTVSSSGMLQFNVPGSNLVWNTASQPNSNRVCLREGLCSRYRFKSEEQRENAKSMDDKRRVAEEDKQTDKKQFHCQFIDLSTRTDFNIYIYTYNI